MYLDSTSIEFYIFCVGILILYWIFKRYLKIQNFILLIASFSFYTLVNLKMAILLAITIGLNYLFGFWIKISENKRNNAKRVMIFGVCLNVAYLAVFKYFNFFIDSFIKTFGALASKLNFENLKLIMPLGISFYTFQAISFLIDIYKGKMNHLPSLLNFYVYMVFFPKIVAGPIERCYKFVPQLEKEKNLDVKQISEGFQLILIGLFKKIVIADIIAVKISGFYSNPQRYDAVSTLFIIFLYTLQIYADFSGYSNIARGVSKFFGIELIINFNYPYLAKNVREFWRGWHISLSRWLTDYIYIPLGGSREGDGKTYRNSMVTMLVAGLWHGEGLNFLFWGFLHAIYLILSRMSGKLPKKEIPSNFISTKLIPVLQVIKNFILVTIAWVFFRSPNFTTTFAIFTRLFFFNGSAFPLDLFCLLMFSLVILFSFDIIQKRKGKHEIFGDLHWAIQGIIYAVMFYMILIWDVQIYAPFIYAGF